MQKTLSRVVAGVMNWGAWGAKLSTSSMAQLIGACVDVGVTSFDHADIYGGYTTEGEWGLAFHQSGIRREDIQLVTKCGIMMPATVRPGIESKHYDYSKAHIIASVENSLLELRTDYIDLLLLHRPSPLLDPEIVHSAVEDLVQQGKLLDVGVSNFTVSQMNLLRKTVSISANQIELSPMALDPLTDGTVDYCQTHDIRPMAWSPLAGGRLFGSVAEADLISTRSRLLAVANKYGWSLDSLAYRFLMHHPSKIQVVTGSSKIDRIQVAVAASEESITDSQWFEILTAAMGREVA